MPRPRDLFLPPFVLFSLCTLLTFSAACNRGTSQPAAKRYSLKGKVISIDKSAGTANIENKPIAGFMDPMVMPYTIKPGSALDPLQPGDSVSAVVVVQADNSYWLENIKVMENAKAPADNPPAATEKNRRSQ